MRFVGKQALSRAQQQMLKVTETLDGDALLKTALASIEALSGSERNFIALIK